MTCKYWECKYKDKCIMEYTCSDIVCPRYIKELCTSCINERACSKERKLKNTSEAK